MNDEERFMANDVRMYDMLISCPGDVEYAVDIAKEVIDEFNQQFQDTLGIGIRYRYWKNSAYAQSGAKPQQLLNKQFVEQCDLAIAIFKNRFGTPTDKYGSGTEEEIEIMLQADRQVFMYFDESPVSTTNIELQQLKKVRDFKRKHSADRGVCCSFNSPEEFRRVLNAHITRYFLTLEKVQEIKNAQQSELILKSFHGGTLYDTAVVSEFDMGIFGKSEKILDIIKVLFDRIPQYQVSGHNQAGDYLQPFGKIVELSDETKGWIDMMAEHMKIKLDDNFYNLGNLKENVLTSSVLYGGRALIGSDDEKKKYNELIELRNQIKRFLGHIQIEKCYFDLIGVQFVVCNVGTYFDEDIDIELHINRDEIILHTDLEVPTQNVDDDDWCFEDIFTIPKCKDFNSYSSTIKGFNSYAPDAPTFPFYDTKDYEEGYRETLDEIFAYTVFEDGDEIIIKLHMDYLKQHTCAAFPTWIFFRKANEYGNIKYTISSKNRTEIVQKSLKMEMQK